MNETNKKRLENLINEAAVKMDMPSAAELAAFLDDNGVIAAPVRIGQEVYVGLSKVFTDEDEDEDEIFAWTVKGVGIDEKGRCCAFDICGDWYIVGDVCCRLTKAEAAAIALGWIEVSG